MQRVFLWHVILNFKTKIPVVSGILVLKFYWGTLLSSKNSHRLSSISGCGVLPKCRFRVLNKLVCIGLLSQVPAKIHSNTNYSLPVAKVSG